MGVKIVLVDAFTPSPFGGNPAGVCVLDEARSTDWMALVAREVNAPATAFVRVRGDGAFELRWFSPARELELCGHGTLATAHVLWESGRLDAQCAARFQTQAGTLTAACRNGWIELDFPMTPAAPVAPPPALLAALDVRPRFVGRSRFDYLVEVENEGALVAVRPDLGLLETCDARGAIVTSAADDPQVDFVSRYFAPAFGIDEDPATGSTHCCLAPYWSARLGRSDLVAHQVSARRGIIRTALAGDRVRLSGQAVTVIRGELLA